MIHAIIVRDSIRIGIDFRFLCPIFRHARWAPSNGIVNVFSMKSVKGVITMNFPVELDDWIESRKASEDENVGRDMYGPTAIPSGALGRQEFNVAVALKEGRRDLE
jgi:hypothetical protein